MKSSLTTTFWKTRPTFQIMTAVSFIVFALVGLSLSEPSRTGWQLWIYIALIIQQLGLLALNIRLLVKRIEALEQASEKSSQLN